jgi:hypothetical protein
MLQRIADWHGEQAAFYYQNWVTTQSEYDLRCYCRHARIAERMWRKGK